jgi:hypothetical protein
MQRAQETVRCKAVAEAFSGVCCRTGSKDVLMSKSTRTTATAGRLSVCQSHVMLFVVPVC